MSKTGYKDEIIKLSKGEIVYEHYNDFDSDGTCEMFAIVGEVIDDNTISGEIWFANQRGAYKIEESKYYWKYPNVHLLGDNMFIAFNEYYTTGMLTYLWGVKNGRPFQPNLTEKARGLIINDYNEIEIIDSAYDATKTKYIDSLLDDEYWTGHTWNSYYYYWNGDTFREYGAIEITLDELSQIEGVNEITEYISDSGAVINEIYYRNNHIIQINYQREEREGNIITTHYNYIMFRYTGEKITLEKCEVGSGNILKALNTSLAIYPDYFNIDLFRMD